MVGGFLAVLVFIGVCLAVTFGARSDRQALDQRVRWLVAIHPGDAGEVDASAALDDIKSCADCRPATLAAAQAYDPGAPQALIRALREESALVSHRLGTAGTTVELIFVGAAVFALAFYALLVIGAKKAQAAADAADALENEIQGREAAAAALREEQAFTRGFFEFAPIGIQVYTVDGLSVRMNAEMARLLGLPDPTTGVGTFNILTDPLTVASGDAAMFAQAARGEVVELRNRSIDLGTELNQWETAKHLIIMDTLMFPLRDEQGAVTHVVSVVRDVSETHQNRQRLVASERLAAVGTLAAGVAHEINNPLAYISSNINWLGDTLRQRHLELPETLWPPMAEAVRDAEDGVARVQAIVRDLGALSSPSGGASGRVCLREAIDPTLRILDYEIRHRAAAINRVTAGTYVLADPQALGQVLLNLVQNAAHAIPPGHPSKQRIELWTTNLADGRTRLAIRDTGLGIPPEVAPRVFDPFFTTKAVGQGMGLGLSVCRGLVEVMGGALTFESTLDVGTTFYLDLPTAAPEVQARAVAPVPEAGRRGRILVVDDEPLLAKALQRQLRARHEVVGVGSGREALDLLRTDAVWDAILLDVMMPEMDGPAVLDALRQLAPDVAKRVIIMSGGTFSLRADTFWRSFQGPHLAKPFDAASLETALRAIMDSPVT